MNSSNNYALRQEGVSETNTSKVYSNNIFTHSFNLVKKKVKRILCSLQMYKVSVAPLLHSQNISDPSGVKIHVALEGSTVSIADKEGNIVKFSAYLVPKVRSTLLDVESAFSRGLSHGKV